MEAMRASDKYNERVSVTLARSRLAEGFVAAATLATLALVASIPLAHAARFAAVTWIGVHALLALRRLRAGSSLTLESSGTVGVDGREGRMRDGAFVAPWLTILRWRPDGAWLDRTLLIAPDRLGAEDARRIRVLLRWSGRANETGTRPRVPVSEAPL
jgi:hypothetical protein